MHSLDSTVVFRNHVLTCVCSKLGTVCEALITLITPQILIGCSRCGGGGGGSGVTSHVSYHFTTCSEHLITLVALRR